MSKKMAEVSDEGEINDSEGNGIGSAKSHHILHRECEKVGDNNEHTVCTTIPGGSAIPTVEINAPNINQRTS